MTKRAKKYFAKKKAYKKLYSDIAFNIIAASFRQQIIMQSPLPNYKLGASLAEREIAKREKQIAIAESVIDIAQRTLNHLNKFNKTYELL